MKEHNGHRERLRDRFLREGLQGFEEHNALELALFYARPRCDTNGLAHVLLDKFGSFSAVLDAPLEELLTVEGVGNTTAVFLKMIAPLGSYYQNNQLSTGMVLNTTEKAGNFFLPKFFGKTKEEVYVACLDGKRKLLRCTCIARDGVSDAVGISVKKVISEALASNATGVIMAHNHPRGVLLPSGGDKILTGCLCETLRMLQIELVDHIIVSGNGYISMADHNFFETKKGK